MEVMGPKTQHWLLIFSWVKVHCLCWFCDIATNYSAYIFVGMVTNAEWIQLAVLYGVKDGSMLNFICIIDGAPMIHIKDSISTKQPFNPIIGVLLVAIICCHENIYYVSGYLVSDSRWMDQWRMMTMVIMMMMMQVCVCECNAQLSFADGKTHPEGTSIRGAHLYIRVSPLQLCLMNSALITPTAMGMVNSEVSVLTNTGWAPCVGGFRACWVCLL